MNYKRFESIPLGSPQGTADKMLCLILSSTIFFLLLRWLYRSQEPKEETAPLSEPKEDLRFLEGHSCSSEKEGIELVWSIKGLIDLTKDQDPVLWEIPKEEILDDWCWGDDHISVHIKRVLDADLSYPVIIHGTGRGEDEGFIMDGYHRTIKALAMNMTHLEARVLINLPPPDKTLHKEEQEDAPNKWTNRDVYLIVKELLDPC